MSGGPILSPAPWRPAFCHGRATYSSLAAGTGAAAARGKKAAFFFLSTNAVGQWCKGGLKSLKMNEKLRWCQNSCFNGDLLITSDRLQNYD
jgi:hypothetical protein